MGIISPEAKFLAQGHNSEILLLTSALAEIKPTVWLQVLSFNFSTTPPLGETSVIWCNGGNKQINKSLSESTKPLYNHQIWNMWVWLDHCIISCEQSVSVSNPHRSWGTYEHVVYWSWVAEQLYHLSNPCSLIIAPFNHKSQQPPSSSSQKIPQMLLFSLMQSL